MSNKAKRYIFYALLIVAVIIWGKNLNLFKSGSGYYQLKSPAASVKKIRETISSDIEFKEPRFNPFVAAKPKTPEPTKSESKKPTVREPEKISKRYKIDGIVIESENPQAVLSCPGKTNILITLNDSIDGWKIAEIQSDQIIFSQDKYRDTLMLEIK